MEREYNEECNDALKSMYRGYGINMDDPNVSVPAMIEAVSSAMDVSFGCSFLSVKDAEPLNDVDYNELILSALEDDYLDSIGVKNLILA